MSTGLTIGLRVLNLVCLLIAAGCTAAGTGVHCPKDAYLDRYDARLTSSRDINQPQLQPADVQMHEDRYSIDVWGSSKLTQPRTRDIQGQWFVFIVEIVFALVCIGLVVSTLRGPDRGRIGEIITIAVALLFVFIAACLEAWYAQGFGVMNTDCYIGSFAAACAFLILSLAVWAADLAVVHRTKKDMQRVRHHHQTPVVVKTNY